MGTGIKGLTGIRPVKERILRPLLSRSGKRSLLTSSKNQLGYRTSTNNSLDYVRNKIRHMIIPVCKDINPSFLNTVRENCNTLKEVEQIYRYGIDRLKEEVLSEENGKPLSTPQKHWRPRPLHTPIRDPTAYGFNATQIEDILESSDAIPGKQRQKNTYLRKVGSTGGCSIS